MTAKSVYPNERICAVLRALYCESEPPIKESVLRTLGVRSIFVNDEELIRYAGLENILDAISSLLTELVSSPDFALFLRYTPRDRSASPYPVEPLIVGGIGEISEPRYFDPDGGGHYGTDVVDQIQRYMGYPPYGTGTNAT